MILNIVQTNHVFYNCFKVSITLIIIKKNLNTRLLLFNNNGNDDNIDLSTSFTHVEKCPFRV